MSGARAAAAVAMRWEEEPSSGRTRPAGHKTERAKASGVTRLAVLFGALAAVLLLYVAEQAWVVSLTYRLNGTKAALHAAEVQTDRLQLRVSELSSPGRIERIAREQLHLVSPERPAYLAETPQVAMVKPPEEGKAGPAAVARIQRLFRGALVQAAPAAE